MVKNYSKLNVNKFKNKRIVIKGRNLTTIEKEIYANRDYCKYKYPLRLEPYREYACWYNLFHLKTLFYYAKWKYYEKKAEDEFMKRAYEKKKNIGDNKNEKQSK